MILYLLVTFFLFIFLWISSFIIGQQNAKLLVTLVQIGPMVGHPFQPY